MMGKGVGCSHLLLTFFVSPPVISEGTKKKKIKEQLALSPRYDQLMLEMPSTRGDGISVSA